MKYNLRCSFVVNYDELHDYKVSMSVSFDDINDVANLLKKHAEVVVKDLLDVNSKIKAEKDVKGEDV